MTGAEVTDRIRLEFIDAVSRKFWETDLRQDVPRKLWLRTVRWGGIDTEGGGEEYDHATLVEARSAQQRAIRDKLGEGYVVKSGDPSMVRAFSFGVGQQQAFRTSADVALTTQDLRGFTQMVPGTGRGFGVSLDEELRLDVPGERRETGRRTRARSDPARPSSPEVSALDVEEPRERVIKLRED